MISGLLKMAFAGVALSVAGMMPSHAEDNYPSRPITMLVGFSAGGSTDVMARIVADGLSKRLNQPVLVENIAGAGGKIAAQKLTTADPDGYTIMFGVVSLTVQQAIDPDNSVDIEKSLAPIASIAGGSTMLLANNNAPFKTLDELAAYAKAHPGEIKFGSAGFGSGLHMWGETFKYLTKVDITHVPYKGEALALTDLISGTIPMMFASPASASAAIATNQVHAVAVADTSRLPEYADVPTFQELGLDFTIKGWAGTFAPKGTPEPVVDLLAKNIREILDTPEAAEQFKKLATPIFRTESPAAFSAYLNAQLELFRKVVAEAGIKPQ